MMWPFKCNHPIALLAVEQKETTERQDNDFSVTTYHFKCTKCGSQVKKRFSTLNDGVDGFLKGKP